MSKLKIVAIMLLLVPFIGQAQKASKQNLLAEWRIKEGAIDEEHILLEKLNSKTNKSFKKNRNNSVVVFKFAQKNTLTLLDYYFDDAGFNFIASSNIKATLDPDKKNIFIYYPTKALPYSAPGKFTDHITYHIISTTTTTILLKKEIKERIVVP